MAKEFYWVISGDEDGGHCHKYTKEQLEEEMGTEDGLLYGISLEPTDEEDHKHLLRDLPFSQYGSGKETQMMYWGDGVLIIKGTVVIPKKKEVVTRYEL